jgi:hypothetical protein
LPIFSPMIVPSPSIAAGSLLPASDLNPATTSRKSRTSLKATDLFKSMSSQESIPTDVAATTEAKPRAASISMSQQQPAPLSLQLPSQPRVQIQTQQQQQQQQPSPNTQSPPPLENIYENYTFFIDTSSTSTNPADPNSPTSPTLPSEIQSPYIETQPPSLPVPQQIPPQKLEIPEMSPLGDMLESAMRLSFDALQPKPVSQAKPQPQQPQPQKQKQQQQQQHQPDDAADIRVTLLADFTAEMPEELSTKAGEVLRLLQPDDEGWTYVETLDGGRRGLVPTSYVKNL